MIKGGPSSPFDAARKSRLAKFSRVSSLVFELELEESNHGSEHDIGTDGAVQELRSLADPWSDVEFKLLHFVRLAKEDACCRRQGDVDSARLAAQLRSSGFDVKICNALGGGLGGECLRNLRHTFLSVTGPKPGLGVHSQQRFIVDLHFKEQFEIAQPSERYERLLATVPSEFVGTEDRITLLVTFLCREISRAFKEQGNTLPPWRQADSMLSKWRPRRSVEHDVLSPLPASMQAGGTAAHSYALRWPMALRGLQA